MTCHNADMFLSLAKSLNDASLPKSQNTKLSYYIIPFHPNKNYSQIPNSWTPTSDSRPHKPIQAHPSLYTYEYTFFLMAIYIYIDIVFCSPSIWVPNLENLKNINFSPRGSENFQIDVA